MLDDEHRELRSTLRRWAESDVAPHAARVDRDAVFPHESWRSFVDNGWVRLQYPERWGGDGADSVAAAILIEEMARVCAASALFAVISKVAMMPVLHFGTDEQCARWVTAVASGTAQASYCQSEADAGSDVAAMRTRAERDGDHYVISGTKFWITNAGESDFYVVFAKTDPDAGTRGISCFVVEAERGVEIVGHEDKMGVRGSPTGEVRFDAVRVPATSRIGAEGDGFRIAMHTLNRSRPGIGAQAVGIAQGALDHAVAYMKERRAFGRPIADFQGLQFMVADAAMRIEASRQLVYEAMRHADADDPEGRLGELGAMAKCFAADTAMAVTTDAVQLLGGYGYTRDFPLERMMRDAKITQIYEGTNQIQRVVIARNVIG